MQFRVATNHVTAGEVAVVLRPEHIAHLPDAPSARQGVVRLLENLGAECVVYFETDGETLVTAVPSRTVAHLDIGSPFPFAIRSERLLVFDGASSARIGQGLEAVNA